MIWRARLVILSINPNNSCCGTHTGEFRGIPPTGRQGCVTGITIDRIANGRVVECWTNADDMGLMRLLGVVPALE